MLGLTQSLLDSFGLAAQEAAFERDQAGLDAHIMVEELIQAGPADEDIADVVARVRHALRDSQETRPASADWSAAELVLSSFIDSRLRGLASPTS